MKINDKGEVEINMPKHTGKAIAGGVAVALLGLYGVVGINNIGLHEAGFAVTMIGSERGQVEELMPGTRWVDPFTQDVFTYDTRNKQYEEGLQNICEGVNTSDGQPICVDLSLEAGLDKQKLGVLHTKYGPAWYEEVIYKKVRSAVRFGTAGVSSDVIYTLEGKNIVANYVANALAPYGEEAGIMTTVNLREVTFSDHAFNQTLVAKATASQKEIIEKRLAAAAIEEANKMANLAEGAKQKRIKAAEADREERRLKGEGQRLEKEENAKGILAVARAEAEGTRLQVNAYGDGKYYSQVKVAEQLGDNFQIWGIPTGAPGTSAFVGLDSIMGKAVMGGTSGD